MFRILEEEGVMDLAQQLHSVGPPQREHTFVDFVGGHGLRAVCYRFTDRGFISRTTEEEPAPVKGRREGRILFNLISTVLMISRNAWHVFKVIPLESFSLPDRNLCMLGHCSWGTEVIA